MSSLVSVIIAVRNGEAFLRQAIDSVLAQSYAPIEVLVIDGQSQDQTALIAQSYPQVSYILQESTGIASAYNLGIAHAQGEFIAFLSHDDIWMPEKLSTQICYMIDNPTTQFTVAYIKFFLEPGHTIPRGFRPELLQGQHPAFIMETLVARRTLFEQIGTFDLEFRVAEDVDWFARAKDAGINSVLLPQVLLQKRVHSTNLSLNCQENNRNLLEVVRRSIHRQKGQSSSREP